MSAVERPEPIEATSWLAMLGKDEHEVFAEVAPDRSLVTG